MATGSFGTHADELARSRHSLKFLDDTKRGVADVLEFYEQVVNANRRVFDGGCRGPLAPLQQFLQPDLGIFLEDGRLVGTTHLMTAQLGYDGRVLQRLDMESFRAWMSAALCTSIAPRALGEYIAAVILAFQQDISPNAREFAPLATVDVKSAAFYAGIVEEASARGPLEQRC